MYILCNAVDWGPHNLINIWMLGFRSVSRFSYVKCYMNMLYSNIAGTGVQDNIQGMVCVDGCVGEFLAPFVFVNYLYKRSDKSMVTPSMEKEHIQRVKKDQWIKYHVPTFKLP